MTSTLIREMTDLTDEQINEQIEAAYETLRNVVEQLTKKGGSPLTLGVALIGVAVESETKAYSVAVLAVELAMVSAPSPALMAQRKVLLLGKLQVDHSTPPYGRPVTAE